MAKKLFFAYLAGSFVIIVVRSRLLFSSEESTIAASFAAVIAVLIITLLGLHYHSDANTDLRLAGDNLYYLGLLFTLMSLIIALLQLFVFQSPSDDGGGDLRHRTHDLIGNFGIALVSTIAGILGRIILQTLSDEKEPKLSSSAEGGRNLQLDGGGTGALARPAPSTVETLPTITESMIELRRTLRDASDAFSHFTRVTQDHAEQAKAHSESMIRNFNAEMVTEAERGLSDVMNTWREAVVTLSTVISRMLQRIDKEVAAATTRTETAWRDLSEEVVAASRSARAQLASDAVGLSTLLDRVSATSKGLESLADSLDVAGASARSLGSMSTEAAEGLNDRAREIVAAYDSLVLGARQVQEEGFVKFGESVGRFTKAARDQLERDSKEWLTSITEIRKSAESHFGKVANDADAVRLVAEEISAQLSKILPRIEQMTDSIEKAVRATDALRGPIALKSGKSWWIDGRWY